MQDLLTGVNNFRNSDSLHHTVKRKYDVLLKKSGFVYEQGVGTLNMKRLNLGEPNCPEFNFTFVDARMINQSLVF